jgi:glyoxylase-like metal-dependent hydrolase (beta-lactamase superfamily II)
LYDYALQLRNFIYILVNTDSRECLVVDACWDIDGIIDYISKQNLKLVGAIVTHYHIDHVGGIPPEPFDKYRVRVDGIAKLVQKTGVRVYAHEAEIDAVIKGNPEMKRSAFTATTDNQIMTLPTSCGQNPEQVEEKLKTGGVNDGRITVIEFIHTPGHTPGSQCLLVNGSRLFAGDVLFIQSHGRTDFPDSSQNLMNDSLRRLGGLGSDVVVYSGHDYGGDCTTVGIEKRCGFLGQV